MRLQAMARSLGPANAKLVFIGAAVLPLLIEEDQRWESPRSTNDIDAVAATASYTERGNLEEVLRKHGFVPDMTARHAGRYRAPDTTIFDLSFAGDHTGGSGSVVDRLAIESATPLAGDPPLRHLSSAGFFLMKCAAFADRGRETPHASKDLADLAVLLVACPNLANELRAQAHQSTKWVDAVTLAITSLRSVPDLRGALRTHWRSRQPVPPDTPDTHRRGVRSDRRPNNGITSRSTIGGRIAQHRQRPHSSVSWHQDDLRNQLVRYGPVRRLLSTWTLSSGKRQLPSMQSLHTTPPTWFAALLASRCQLELAKTRYVDDPNGGQGAAEQLYAGIAIEEVHRCTSAEHRVWREQKRRDVVTRATPTDMHGGQESSEPDHPIALIMRQTRTGGFRGQAWREALGQGGALSVGVCRLVDEPAGRLGLDAVLNKLNEFGKIW